MSTRLLDRLADLAREELELWSKLVAGKLPEADEARLQQAAKHDAQVAARYKIFRPFSDRTRSDFADEIERKVLAARGTRDAEAMALPQAVGQGPAPVPHPSAKVRCVPGAIIANRYEVDEVIGGRGSGTMVRAHDRTDGTVVAIKLWRHGANDPEGTARLQREALVKTLVQSEHVVGMLDWGLVDGMAFVVKEYLEGCDLGEWLLSYGPLARSAAANVIVQACEALAPAHAVDIVHGDVRPANLFAVTNAESIRTIKLLDFAISSWAYDAMNLEATKSSSARSHAGGRSSNVRRVTRTPMYLAPEQCESADGIDGRADIWSLGATFVELLTGCLPFEERSLVAHWERVTSGHPPQLAKLDPSMPLELQAIILKCLEPDRERRYANVQELAAAVRAFV